MSASTKKISPVHIEAMLHNAISRRLRERGITDHQEIADGVILDLTGNVVINPPAGVPHKFTVEGVHLEWPHGLDTRIPSDGERAPFNSALVAIGRTVTKDNMMGPDDNVRVLRDCYKSLWRRVVMGIGDAQPSTQEPEHATRPMVEVKLQPPVTPAEAPQRKTMDEVPSMIGKDTRKPASKATRKPRKPVITTAMEEHRNPVLHAIDGQIVNADECTVCIQPVVPDSVNVNSLDDALAALEAVTATLKGGE